MILEKLVLKYIASAEHVLSEVRIVKSCVNVDADGVKKVLDFAKTYLEDAKYYKERNRFEVSLTSVAYCEGLLDALKLLGAVKFEWPVKEKESGK